VCVFGLETKNIGPCLRLWARGSPSFLKAPLLPSPSRRGGWRAAKAHGLDRQAGGGTACGRAWACNVTPHALRRANAASSAYASVSDRAAPGAMCPWRVIPEAARGSGLRKCPPAGCRSRSPLSRRLMKTPSTMDRDGGSIITLPVKSTAISLLVKERETGDRGRARGREHECTNENESDDYTALSEQSAAIPPFCLRSALLARLLVGAV